MNTPTTSRFKMPPTVWALGWVSFFTDVSTEIIYPLLPVFLTVTAHAADPRQTRPAMRDQPIDEGAVLVPRRRVHDEPRRLVDDDEILVLMDDGERQSLAERLGGKRRRDAEIDPTASPDLARGIAHHDPVAAHEALAHQALEPGTGEIVEDAGKDAVEPLGNGSLVEHEAARLVRAGDHGKHRGGHREDSRHFAPESACGVRDASLYEPQSARKLPSSSGLGRRPLTAKTGVRFPLGAPPAFNLVAKIVAAVFGDERRKSHTLRRIA